MQSNLAVLRTASKCIASNEEMLGNIESAVKRGLPDFVPSLCKHDGTAILCGSGPSLAKGLKSLKRHIHQRRPVWAMNDSHDWLIDNGIVPDVCLLLDPSEQLSRRVNKLDNRVIYLVASQCNPAVFEKLKDMNVMVWHALSHIGEEKLLGGKIMIGGGTTVGMRALCIAYLSGFHRVVLYGYDSCLFGNLRRITGETDDKTLDIFCGGKKYVCNPAMASQAEQLQPSLDFLGSDFKVKAMGSGLIAGILKERRRLGVRDW